VVGVLSPTAQVSVIVPTFNVAGEIARCLTSLQAQTVAVEILVVDDASHDGTADIVARLAAQDPRIRLTRLAQNQGVQRARFVGVAQARGAYVGFVDGDDWVEPVMFATLVAAAEQHQADVAVCDAWHERLGQPPQRLQRLPRPLVLDTPEALLRLLTDRRSAVALWNKLFRREVWQALLAQQQTAPWPRIDVAEDSLLCAVVFAGCQRLAYVPEPLYHYIERPGSAMHGLDPARVRQRMANYHQVLQVLDAECRAHWPVLAAFNRRMAEILFDSVTRDIAKLDVKGAARRTLRAERNQRFGRQPWVAFKVWLDGLL